MANVPDITVLHEDAHVLVVDKPAGFETVVRGTRGRCLTSHLRRERNAAYLQPCHRLDRDTTGVQVFALDEEALKRVESAFRQRTVGKSYLALCRGIPRQPEGTVRKNLSKWGGGRRAVQVVRGQGGLSAETSYRQLAFSRPLGVNRETMLQTESGKRVRLSFLISLLQFSPKQGRTHQVRVHAAELGHPILGDDQYGDRRANRAVKDATGLRRQALHAWRLRLPPPFGGEPLCLEAPVPADMGDLLDAACNDWPVALGNEGW